jgi:DNA modification methylase
MPYRPHTPPHRTPPRDEAWEEQAPQDGSFDKRALSHLGGPTELRGDPQLAQLLAHAFDVGSMPRDELTHGFHTYPARMHWATCARIYEGLNLSGGSVLDPFCGSGTALVEARTHGLVGTGGDLNPLAVRLSALKTNPFDRAYRESIVLTASEVRAASEELVQARANVRANLPPEEVRWYEPHVLKEMAGLCQSIEAVDDPDVREAFVLVFSSLVVKFSRQRSDTAEQAVERKLRKGLVSEFFERKACELADRLEALARAARGPVPTLHIADARRAPNYTQGKVDLVLTSPPYGGTYDYVAHHARRFAWLGISPSTMASEIGSRRDQAAAHRFEGELFDVLVGLSRVVHRDGLVILLMGDGQHGQERVTADELVESMAEDAGLRPLAIASQGRPDFRGGAGRREHLMALAKA